MTIEPAYYEHDDETLTGKQRILEGLNEQQKLPVRDYCGASMIIAGAGSGKTKVIVSRTAYMIEDGVDPRSILLFTFTRKGAEEIRDRVRSFIGSPAADVTVGTYHSFCMRLLKKHIEELSMGWTRSFSIYDEDDKKKLLESITKAQKGEASMLDQAETAKAISSWKERMMPPSTALSMSDPDDTEEQYEAEIYREYMRVLQRNNALDFDDLIYMAIRLLEKVSWVREALNRRYKYIVADESQDSSPRDLRLIELLGGEAFNVCMAGDDFQAIYGFRGSNINAFFDFVEAHSMKEFRLEQNYRSTQTIVDAAQSVIRNNARQFRKKTFSRNPVGEKIVLVTSPDQKREAAKAVSIINFLKRNAGMEYGDIAVLYRAGYLSRELEEHLISAGIPYRMRSGTPFYERREIKDIVSYLRILSNPRDWVSFERALKVSNGIGGKLCDIVFKNCFNYETLCDIITTDGILRKLKGIAGHVKGRARKGLLHFIGTMRQLSDARASSTPAQMVETAIRASGYIERLKEKDMETFDERKENLEELSRAAEEFETLDEFLSSLSSAEGRDGDDEREAVNLMTVHGSKGLEFGTVILIGMADGVFPHAKEIIKGDVSEERRLFYVAMTRAKKFLFITRPEHVAGRGHAQYRPQSRFIGEIDPEFVYELD